MIAIPNTLITDDGTIRGVLRAESGLGGGALVVDRRLQSGFSVVGSSREGSFCSLGTRFSSADDRLHGPDSERRTAPLLAERYAAGLFFREPATKAGASCPSFLATSLTERSA